MKIETTRFGEIDVDEASVVNMPEGMLGFREIKDYVLIQQNQESPFLWFQAVGEPDLAFIIVDPFIFFPEYEALLSAEDIEALGCAELGNLAVFVVTVIPDSPENMTANLRGPVVINVAKRIGRQVVLNDGRYSPHQLIMEKVNQRLAEGALLSAGQAGDSDAGA